MHDDLPSQDIPTDLMTLSIDLTKPIPTARSDQFHLGTSENPSGGRLSSDSLSLLENGQRFLPVMGEFHYARFPESGWRDELLKMQAGGVSIVASYVFWIHHEEIEGQWEWTGRKDLRGFCSLCGELGLKVIVRGGPWAHGECRNGGFPDWVVKKYQIRTDEPAYLDEVSKLFAQIANQLQGLYWKHGGPIIGFQVENEFGGPGEHLMSLKRLAVAAGIDVPYYTRTGWPGTSTPVPEGELFPLYGGYPEGFWDRELTQMPPAYQKNFFPNLTRNDGNILQDHLDHPASDHELAEAAMYPYLCCEIGGGMPASYHRRIAIDPTDIESLSLVKIASGNNLQGYYMYHGGWNPEGKLTTLNETQATGYWNDLPVKTYDFHAPIGENGEIHEHYRTLRPLHLFLADFGKDLAGMPAFMPDTTPRSVDDLSTLPWTVRTDGASGFIFVTNSMRLYDRGGFPGTQFELNLPSGRLVVPSTPMDIPANSSFFLPFNMKLGPALLKYATAQPICHVSRGDSSTYFFKQVGEAEFCFDPSHLEVVHLSGRHSSEDGLLHFHDLKPGPRPTLQLRAGGKLISIVLLNAEECRWIAKGTLGGEERVVIGNSDVLFDEGALRLFGEGQLGGDVAIYPAPTSLECGGKALPRAVDGDLVSFRLPRVMSAAGQTAIEKIADAGPAREVKLGQEGVAEQPSDSDFDHAAAWRLKVPAVRSGRLTISYYGDVARLYVGSRLITDNFYNGKPFAVDVNRLECEENDEVILKILPLRPDAPIYLPAPEREGAGVKEVGVRVRCEAKCVFTD